MAPIQAAAGMMKANAMVGSEAFVNVPDAQEIAVVDLASGPQRAALAIVDQAGWTAKCSSITATNVSAQRGRP
jgi:hypothetical protein